MARKNNNNISLNRGLPLCGSPKEVNWRFNRQNRGGSCEIRVKIIDHPGPYINGWGNYKICIAERSKIHKDNNNLGMLNSCNLFSIKCLLQVQPIRQLDLLMGWLVYFRIPKCCYILWSTGWAATLIGYVFTLRIESRFLSIFSRQRRRVFKWFAFVWSLKSRLQSFCFGDRKLL